jgi:branched-chain amino acid transport system substrate-binding protein
MTPYITAIMAAKPDFVAGGLWGADLINFTKQAKPYGYFDKVVSSGVYDLNQLRALGDEMVEGAVSWNRGEFFSVDTPAMAAFVEKFRKAYNGEYPTAYAVFAHEALYVVKKAMETAGTTNKEKVVDAMIGMHFTGPRGELYFRACDNQANAPEYIGFTKKDPRYPFCVLRDVMVVKAEDAWLSCEEIKKLRAGK